MPFYEKPILQQSGTMLLLLTLALVSPSAVVPNLRLPTEAILVASAYLILWIRIYRTIGLSEFCKTYRNELVLILAYQLLCTASLALNFDRYADLHEFFRWGVVFVVGQTLLPVCAFIFLLPNTHNHNSLTKKPFIVAIALGILATLPLLALWQVYDNEGAHSIYRFTIAGNLANDPTIRSVFATSTDFGSISAVISIAFCILAFQHRHKYLLYPLIFFFIAALAFIAGLQSGARVFLLMLGSAAAYVTIVISARDWRKGIIAIFALMIATVIVAQNLPPSTASKFKKMVDGVPYLHTEETRLTLVNQDSALRGLLGERYDIWRLAVTRASNNLPLGISNGGFRLEYETLSGSRLHNTHNVLLQSLIDSGILGFAILLLLFCKIWRRSTQSQKVLIIGVLSGLMVDNFTDHSFAWIVIVAFLAGNLGRLSSGDRALQ
jgi:hypothetical protein